MQRSASSRPASHFRGDWFDDRRPRAPASAAAARGWARRPPGGTERDPVQAGVEAGRVGFFRPPLYPLAIGYGGGAPVGSARALNGPGIPHAPVFGAALLA